MPKIVTDQTRLMRLNRGIASRRQIDSLAKEQGITLINDKQREEFIIGFVQKCAKVVTVSRAIREIGDGC